MTPEQIQQQRETDEDILAYTRGLQDTAPVTQESMLGYLVNIRRRRVTEQSVADRVNDLVGRKLLLKHKLFAPGRGWVNQYDITPRGRGMLDRAIPWDWEEVEP